MTNTKPLNWTTGATIAIALVVLSGCAASSTPVTTADHQVRYRISESGDVPPGLGFNSGTSVSFVEAAINHLDRDRAGGPDYNAAARLFVHAARAADENQEIELAVACYRAAARSALRAGNRAVYEDAVRRWADRATSYDREVGEIAIHMAIVARLNGKSLDLPSRVPASVQRLILGKKES